MDFRPRGPWFSLRWKARQTPTLASCWPGRHPSTPGVTSCGNTEEKQSRRRGRLASLGAPAHPESGHRGVEAPEGWELMALQRVV